MMKPNLKINIAGIELKNPVMTASGTFGSGREYGEFVDLNKLGAVVVKGVSSTAWKGNPTPRVAETYGGMLNSVGLQNPGVAEFIEKDIPFLRKYDTKIIVNIAGKTVEEYCAVAERLASEDVDMLELNISCPNVKEGGVCFGTDPQMAEYVTKEVKKYTKQPLIVKLTPNVTDVTEIARAAVAGGADALSLINTLTGMAIDIHKRKPILANVVGGLSGPAIKPVAVRMVYQVAQAVDIPIIGMGGIMTGEDAVEFLLAGATGVAVGTANFTNPMATMDVLEGIEDYLEQYALQSIEEVRGKLYERI
ncbi:dihydroorotate dehydrogenase [Clostridium formicaceticum]|uniref:Dihydroorotate dehydrogenase n=1 Tax=Clostridium formicaceticum TaxID=1497 RepID=A0AAC9WHR8_9CLOT|nr:dihydroorotate dehydrogenase [Clostridium formicaceticum]AOY74863.1 dihydroorotate dehydrogenase B catalytic subunit [Clostridium formicaceticum]ARE89263.1 Dihydroorotate dehydrogenase B, catalytic subunit [Clostridium formicaceticum]